MGTCRHFAVLACALLRHRGVPARVRCGFATYFQKGQGLDHWIIEYWNHDQTRWVRIDPEVLGQALLPHPEDLRPGEFLTGGEAWSAYRRGEIDASTFGVYGTENWGPGEIRGNTVKDLAALNKVETLPWDEWGRMEQGYKGETGPDYDELLDEVAVACASADQNAVATLYTREDMRVPSELIR
ncbi:MAG TPA: transglutaminase-like domain-containing protein [Acidimicrobiales bacterium]|nr:transglutaminase-like domain-containing protein [Acidimicrobiales bacterium]